MPTPQHRPTNQENHNDIASSIERINVRLDAIDEKLTPISELYTAGKVGGSLLKWFIGFLAGLAGVAAFIWGAPGK